MPAENSVSLRWIMSTSFSRMWPAFSTPFMRAMSAVAPMSTSPTPTLQPP